MPEAAPTFRRARADDVPDIVRLLADDPLGAARERHESPPPESYARAFRAIEQDANNELVVACRGERVVGGCGCRVVHACVDGFLPRRL